MSIDLLFGFAAGSIWGFVIGLLLLGLFVALRGLWLRLKQVRTDHCVIVPWPADKSGAPKS